MHTCSLTSYPFAISIKVLLLFYEWVVLYTESVIFVCIKAFYRLGINRNNVPFLFESKGGSELLQSIESS